VEHSVDFESNPIAERRAKEADCAELIRRDGAILDALKHLLPFQMRSRISDAMGARPSIATEYAWQGSLANHFTAESRLRGRNRIANVIAGIARALRFAHSRGRTQRDLKPQNVLLRRDWSVRIANFGLSAAPAVPAIPPLTGREAVLRRPSSDLWDFAPECVEGFFHQARDVFTFGRFSSKS
jgi:serine/threonine protein kinase